MVYRIIALTVLIYCVQLWGGWGRVLTNSGALVPDGLLKGQLWRLFTYGFLHDRGIFHVAFNMLGLWFFGRELESFWGPRKFLTFYIFGIIVSGLFSFVNLATGFGHVNIIGASGAVYAVLLVYAILFPEREILLYFFIRIPVRIAVLLLAVASVFGFLAQSDGIAHMVHLGGFAAGWLFFKYGDTVMGFVNPLFNRKAKPKKKEQATFHTFEKKEQLTVDDILRKIHRKGMSSLTKEERRILEEYSSRN